MKLCHVHHTLVVQVALKYEVVR